jgi:hypothetical protein
MCVRAYRLQGTTRLLRAARRTSQRHPCASAPCRATPLPRVALWGVSYSGGHVLATAARLGPDKVSAVVSNEPYLRAQTAVSKLLKVRARRAHVQGSALQPAS